VSPAEHLETLVDHALAYAAQGLEVFPVKPASKAPYTEHGMKEATRDPATITGWWRRWPDALVAARVPADMAVLDLDPRHGGVATWELLEQTYSPVVVTRWHASGRGDGGRHLWFRRPAGKLSVKRLNDWARDNGVGHQAGKRSWSAGIDVLHHDHRYTILPPSPHPETGKPYTWGAQGEPGDMPGWLVHYLTIDPAPPLEAPKLRLVADPDSIADWFSGAHSWHDILGPDGWTLIEGDGDRDGSKWRHPNASAESSASVKHGCLFVYSPNTDFPVTEDGDPNGVTRFRAWAILEHDGDLRAAAREAFTRRDGDMTEWRERLETQARKENPVEPSRASESDDPRALLLDWDEFWALDHQAEDWLIEPVIPRGRSVAIYAPGGTGKSLFSLYLAACAATGRRVLGRDVGPFSVLYLDYEMTKADLFERLDAMGFGPEDTPALKANLHYALLPAIDPLDTRAGARVVVDLARTVGAQLVMIDTFARAISGEENDADTIRDFYRHTGVALKAAERACVRLDHSGKDREKGARGSSAKKDDVDVEWLLTAQEGGMYTLKATKRRTSWVPDSVTLELVEGDVLEFRLLEGESTVTMPAGTGEVADRLDRLTVPLDVSARKAGQILAEAGTGARGVLVRAAVKFRREKAKAALERHIKTVDKAVDNHIGTASQNPGRGAPDTSWDAVGTRSTNTQVTDSGRGRDAADAPLWSKRDAVPPPRGDASQDADSKPDNLLIGDDLSWLDGNEP